MSKQDPRTRYRGAFRTGFLISALLHLLAVYLYPRILDTIPEGIMPRGEAAQSFVSGGTALVNLEEVPSSEEPETPPEEPDPEAEEPAAAAPGGVFPGGDPSDSIPDEEATGLSAAERLRARPGDLRLWAPIDPSLTALTDEQIMSLRLIAELEARGELAAAEAERARAALDWTYTDDEGKRWGVSPGKLHLGDITLPLPFGFSAPPSVREANQDRYWQWDDIDRGAARALADQTLKERAKAIRERKDRERKADTTRIGR
jgi:hypothetical protein